MQPAIGATWWLTNFRTIAESTANFIARELTHPSGGFFSSLDADSESQEGKYYTWTVQEISEVMMDKQELDLFISAFGVTEAGNFDDVNVLQKRVKSDDDLANDFNLTTYQVSVKLENSLERFRSFREIRGRPITDDKVLVVWNCLVDMVFWIYGCVCGVYLV